MTKKISSLGELIKAAKPKLISILIEVPETHQYGDEATDDRNVSRIEKILDIVEEMDLIGNIERQTALVFKVAGEKGHAKVLPSYGFLDPKYNWEKIRKADIVIVDRLDGMYEVVKVPEGIDLLPYTQLPLLNLTKEKKSD